MLENEIHINEDNLVFNYQYYKNKTSKNIIAVLKSNAYGHGLIPIAKILDSLNVYMIAVSNIQEGINLRQHNIKTQILILEPIEVKDMLNCYYYHLTPVISSLHQFNKLSKAKFFASLPVHLKIDSGMHRLGVDKEEAIVIKEKLNIYSNLKLTGLLTHLIGIEKIEGYINNQIKHFEEIIDIYNDPSLCIHMTSTSTLDIDSSRTNSIRIGLGLYGLKDPINTKQILSLYSPIINTRKIKQNEYAAYNNTFKAPSNGYIYTIPLGYQSGILLKYKIKPTIDNKVLQVAGNKCMNQTLLFSKQLYFNGEMISIIDEKNTLLDLANRSNVSIYELVCLLNSNIKRVVI